MNASIKKIEFVPKEEIRKSIEITISTAFSISKDDAISEALSIIGFQRSTAKAKQYIDEILEDMIKNNFIKIESNKLFMENKIV